MLAILSNEFIQAHGATLASYKVCKGGMKSLSNHCSDSRKAVIGVSTDSFL